MTVALSEAKDKLSSLVDEVWREHEVVQITRQGQPAAVLMSADDHEPLQETIFWLAQSGIHNDIKAARAAYEAGEAISADDLRAEYGLR